MIKKLLMVFVLVMSFGTCAFADTPVQPPTGLGTYVDFYHDVRVQWTPVSGAVAFKVYVDKGYNNPNSTLATTVTSWKITYYNKCITTYVSTPDISWYTIKVTSIDKYGNESVPRIVNVNVWR